MRKQIQRLWPNGEGATHEIATQHFGDGNDASTFSRWCNAHVYYTPIKLAEV